MVESAVQSHAEMVVDSTEKLKIRVLHVDDELGLLKVAKQCLEMQGPFHVDTAGSVEEALAKLEKEQYDAVVSDYEMPGKDGLEFLEMLRKNGNTVPFIMFTGKGREEVAIRALNLGANQYLNKTGETETVYTELAHAITELAKAKKGEELLRLSEERYKGLFENARDVIVLFDLKGNVTSVNKAAEEYGFNKSEILGKNMLKFVSKRYWPKLLKDVAPVTLGKTAKGRIEIHTPKGDKMAEYRSNPIFSHDKVVGIQTILEDITERKKTEETLRESEEKYRNLFESAMDAIVTLDLKGSITAANSYVLRFGYEKDDLVGKNILDFVSKEYWPAVMRDFSKVAQGEPAKNEVELAVPTGKILVEYHAGAIVKENNVVGMQINMRDVTERKKSEELLRESEERFRDLFESIQDPVCIYVGREGRLLDYSTAFKEFMGYTDEELKGKVFLDFVHPDDRALVLERYHTKYSEEELPLVYEIVVITKKGETIPVEISVSTYKKKGRVIGIEVIHRDITERKKVEEERREVMEKVQMMNEKLRVVGGLTRHDVNNKLAAVTGNVYLARKKLSGNSEVLDYLKQIEASVEQTARIFDFAKAYEMLGVEELAYVDVEKKVDGAVLLFPSLKDVKVMNDCHGLTVLADSLLRQLFYNLIDNSLKYGKKLSQIRIHYEKAEGNQLRLVYEDDGVGMAWDAKPKLFSEGYTTGKGSGYGLYLIKRMMEVYGWAIQETGTPGNGVRFTIVIPEKNQNGKENYRLH